MTKLTQKNVPFLWDDKCQKALQLAKTHLQSSPVMVYPDKSKIFHLFTDMSNYTWSSVLMQVSDDPLPSGNPSSSDSPERREGKATLKWRKQPPTFFFNPYEQLCFIVAPFPERSKTGVLSLRKAWQSLKLSSVCHSTLLILMFSYTVIINRLRNLSVQLWLMHE